jgi:hypothetical protein
VVEHLEASGFEVDEASAGLGGGERSFTRTTMPVTRMISTTATTSSTWAEILGW